MWSIATSHTRAAVLRGGFGWLLPHLAGVGLLFAWLWSMSIVYDFGMSDESWFLQVLTRVVNGDVLYRDVFFGATPLAVYLAAPLVAVFGSEIVVLKAFVSLCSAVTMLLCVVTFRCLGNSRRSGAFLLLALVAYGWPRQSSGYTPLAYTCLLGSMTVILAWRMRTLERPHAVNAFETLGLAGGLAGLCFASKQNLGAYTFAALGGVLLLTLLEVRAGWRQACRAAFVIAAAAALTVLLTLVPVLMSGAFTQFLDYGFTNKRTYLRTAGISYFDGLRTLAQDVRLARSFDDMRWAYLETVFLLPPLALAILAVACITSNRQQRGHLVGVSCFAGAALLGVYPRADLEHVIYAIPAVLLCLAYGWRLVGSHSPRWLRYSVYICLTCWFVLGIGFLVGGAVRRITSPDYERSTLPHFRGVWLTKHEHATHHRYAQELGAVSAGEQPFMLGAYAGFSYLITGLDNPTPFDYPLVTAFGQHGMADLMRSIEHGHLRSICMTRDNGLPFTPHELKHFVRTRMEPVVDLEFCTMYRTPTH